MKTNMIFNSVNKVVLSVSLLSGLLWQASAATISDRSAFVDSLIGCMTLEEKLGQLNLPAGHDIVTGNVQNGDTKEMIRRGQVGGVFNIKGVGKVKELQRIAVEESRLGIPLLVGADVIHGYETIFPIPLALSCSWDTTLVENVARISAIEAAAGGVNWTFSPMVDIAHDARWGRIAEGNGEDPYLGSLMAKAYVRGYQGGALDNPENIMACVKHFACYGATESGRDYNVVDMSRWNMFNAYFAPYKAAVDAGVGSLMPSFNIIDGVPATGNRWLLADVLRNRWGFKGVIVTDYYSIGEMNALGIGPRRTGAVLALRAGVDMDMVSHAYLERLKGALEDGEVTMDMIDNAVRRILNAKVSLGLFEDPYSRCDVSDASSGKLFSAEHRKVARDVAAKTFVLMKNDNSLLPLKKNAKIALVGPMAHARNQMAGTWSFTSSTKDRHRSVLDGLRDAATDSNLIVYAQGCNIYFDEKKQNAVCKGLIPRGDDKVMLADALAAAADADVIVACLGESADMSGESACRTDLNMPDAQKQLLEAMVATGKPVVLLLFGGRPVSLCWEKEYVPAILNVWYGGSEAGDAIADVLYGDKAPQGRLTTTFPRTVGQMPLYYNHLPTSRPDPEDDVFNLYQSNWIDERTSPLYPFGYGLTYTTFSYDPVKLSSDKMPKGGAIEATVKVTNTGKRGGTEVVQLYLRDRYASFCRPVQELKHFSRVTLKPGESRDVTFLLTEEDLKFYNADLEYVYEPGEFQLMIGPDCQRVETLTFTAE